MEGSDTAVLALARTGDGEAFRMLVERYSRAVFRLAFRMTGNEHDAEEVVQETFLRVYKNLERFEERAGVGTWIYRIATNCSLDWIRMRQRDRDNLDRPKVGEEEQSADRLANMPAAGPSPERLLLSTEVQERVEWAMQRLTPMEKAAFTLRHYEGLSIDEIARTLKLRDSATKNNIFRAVRKLRQALEPLVNTP